MGKIRLCRHGERAMASWAPDRDVGCPREREPRTALQKALSRLTTYSGERAPIARAIRCRG
jgi:hypothetical protein